MATRTHIDLRPLRERHRGAVHGPGDLDWHRARQAWQLAVDQHPAAVAVPESEADVVAAVNFAREAGLRVAPQATGHNAGPLAPALADALLVKTGRLRGVELNPPRARVGGGAQWQHVVVPARRHGLAALHGSSTTVGVAGYSLCGGLGWLARRYGLQANSVTAVELVTADGAVVRADEQVEADLFWALRGGGGNFGVVTAIEFELKTALAGAAATRRVSGELEPWVSERTYLGFTSKPIDARTAFEPAAYRRLQRIKAEVDPDGLFRANHAIDPAAGGETTKG
jgi:FAD/FMN-containing dehydrogenase